MLDKLQPYLEISDEVSDSIAKKRPLVALESTVITHGLPYPRNLELASRMEARVREFGAIPATIALVKGKIKVGAPAEELEELAVDPDVHKISVRDIGPGMAMGWNGGTTVASTSLLAFLAGIRVFATGGIGGVHREPPYDISADLTQLAETPVVVVCAGAKAILDLPATIEVLETNSVPVIGYQTDYFPAFYSISSGLPVSTRVDTANQAASIARYHWGLGLNSAVLVAAPAPEDAALPHEEIEAVISQAIKEALEAGVRGQQMTPFLLAKVNEKTQNASLQTNLALLLNNARIAAQIAVELSRDDLPVDS